MIAKRTITRSVPTTSTTLATPGVDPARASVVVSVIDGSVCRGSVILLSSQIAVQPANAPARTLFRLGLGRRNRRRVEEQRLGNRSLNGRSLERLCDQERRLGASAGQQPLGERRYEYDRD